MLSEIRELRPGMLIHRTYRIIRKLGQGGMGTVFLADHVLMEEPRALKFLSSELSKDAAFTGRFRREVRTLRQVRHKNVVDCGDLEQAEDDSLFFAMEFVNGPDLNSFLHKAPKPFDIEMALAITEGIAEGLAAAHALGMVHRDIKPENILMARIGNGWVPKIADFGIVATKETSNYTQTGLSLLTPYYAAPEQWRGARAADLDGRTDLYALGGLLFLMLTGEKVFAAENYEGWAYQHQQMPARAPSNVRPELSDWKGLDALVTRMLAKEPEARPRDVAEFLSLLAAVRYTPPTTSRKTVIDAPLPPSFASVTPVGPAPTLPLVAPAVPPPVVPQVPKRTPVWVWAAGVVILIAAAFAAGRILLPGPAKPSADTSSQPLPADSPKDLSATPKPAQETPVVAQPTKPVPEQTPTAQDKTHREPQPVPPSPSSTKPPAPTLSVAEMKSRADALYSEKNFAEAAKLYKQTCDKGVADSCNRLGFLYQGVQGISQDYAQAAKFFSKACEAGSAAGCNNLGVVYDKGLGTQADSSRAAIYFLRSCDGANGNGCTNLGHLYMIGRGVEKSPAKGKNFFTKGCSLGDPQACNRLQSLK